ncbi:hypothetical protein KEM60_00434 [Austwickia sp. TVS 96-490-7B]|nr:hypothetical protein [Austwickia sp. TVS 96-490-7B]
MASDDGHVLDDAEIRRRLISASASAFADDPAGLNAAGVWLSGLTAAQLLRVDGLARQRRWEGSALGRAQEWTKEVMNDPTPVSAALASMHADGFVRERAVARLAAAEGLLADRALALRLTDHVPAIREAAARAVLVRTTQASAMRIMPILELIRDRLRAGDVRVLYLRQLIDEHGEAVVLAAMRESEDRDLRRAAFRQSLASGLLAVEDAVPALRTESDQVVRSLLSRVIAETAPPDIVMDILLTCGTAEARALGLVRLTAEEINPALLKELLVDTSVLVRMWARTRWADLDREALPTYRAMASDRDLSPRLRARAYTGVLEAGGTIDHDEAIELVRLGKPALAKVGLKQLADVAEPEDVVELFDVMRFGSNKEARLASSGLIRLRRFWAIDDLATMKQSGDSRLRRRAWWLHRGLGGWEETLADLEILLDHDVELSRYGRAASPPMYDQLDEEQRMRLRSLIARAELPHARLLDIAVAGGVRDVVPDR